MIGDSGKEAARYIRPDRPVKSGDPVLLVSGFVFDFCRLGVPSHRLHKLGSIALDHHVEQLEFGGLKALSDGIRAADHNFISELEIFFALG